MIFQRGGEKPPQLHPSVIRWIRWVEQQRAIGDLILPGLLGVMTTHSRETVFNQLVFHEMRYGYF